MLAQLATFFFKLAVISAASVNLVLAKPCTEENSQSPACRGIKTYFYAKYKMDLGIGAGIKLLSVSCVMKTLNNQCRDYLLLETSNVKLNEMEEGCRSMGGHFSQDKCSDADAISRCNNIVRNYHSPDVIYSTLHYKPDNSPLPDSYIADQKFSCDTLGGAFKLPVTGN